MNFAKLAWAGLASLLSGCSPLDAVNIASRSAEYRVDEDIPYGELPRQTLDVYAPRKADPTGCRILFVYGGNWRNGDKRDYGFVGAAFARDGHEVTIPDYRLYPNVTFPQFVQDIALSVSWLQKRDDQRPLVLMGHSAGALIAALLSYNEHYLNAVGEDTQQIAALVTLAGPHDFFLPTDNPRWRVIFGEDPQQQLKALPIRHVSSGSPQTLIIHGADDKLVTPSSAQSLAAKLAAHEVSHQVHLYPNIGHRRLIASVAPPLQFLAPTYGDIQKFLENNICTGAN